MPQTRFIEAAIALSRRASARDGTAPYGAVVVKDGAIVGEGLNHARARNDPTSHGEIEAIRDAARRLGTTDLSGCDLYASCEPCPLCVAAMELAGIRSLTFAASAADGAAALSDLPADLRSRVPIADLRAEVGKPPSERRMPSRQEGREEAVAALAAWAEAARRG